MNHASWKKQNIPAISMCINLQQRQKSSQDEWLDIKKNGGAMQTQTPLITNQYAQHIILRTTKDKSLSKTPII